MALVYISALLLIVLLMLEAHNSYKYLYSRKKYKVFSVALFYALAIPSTFCRLYQNIWIVYILTYSQPFSIGLPPILKILIGICQVLTMIELALLLEISMSPGKQRTYERLIKFLRAIVAFISLFAITSWTIACILVRRPSNEQLEK